MKVLLSTMLWLFLFAAVAADIPVVDQSIDTPANLMAISVRHSNDIWVSGADASIYRSQDRGQSWGKIAPPADSVGAQFRDIETLGNSTVVLMSAGEGKASNVYLSSDNGRQWLRVLQAREPNAFYDCLVFEDERHGWLYGDAIDSSVFLMETTDGGRHWRREVVPLGALAAEGGFASSGTCIDSKAEAPLVIGTGNGPRSRLLIRNKGWRSAISPLAAGEASGIFSLQRRGSDIFVSGGALSQPQSKGQVYRYNLDNEHWQHLGDPELTGAIYGSAISGDYLLVSNPSGVSAFSLSSERWQKVDSTNVWAMACDSQNNCWGVGAKGNVRRLYIPR